jgi:hypothetical protein
VEPAYKQMGFGDGVDPERPIGIRPHEEIEEEEPAE